MEKEKSILVTCKACGHQAPDLKPHFIGGRSPSCTMALDEYQEKYPDEEVVSEAFKAKLAELKSKKKLNALTPKKFSISKTFGLSMGKDNFVTGFVERTPAVPEIDPEYKFPPEATKIILLGLQTNRPTMVHGPTGSGKSSCVEQIAARINYPVMRVNHHKDMYSYDIVGQKKIEDGQTAFEYGPAPVAMRQPMILIMDEWDATNPEVALLYQSLLERKSDGSRLGNLVLTANGGERIESDPFFRIIATSNTTGLGDDKGYYQGTEVQNIAFVSRFLLRVKLDYMDKKQESELLEKKFPALSEDEATGFAKVANLIRKRFEAGELNVPYSVRDLINWVDLYLMIGDASKAMQFSCTSILPYTDEKVISEIVQRIFS